MSLKVGGRAMDILFRFDWYRMGSLGSVFVGVGAGGGVVASVAKDGLELINEAMMAVVEAMRRMLSRRSRGAS